MSAESLILGRSHSDVFVEDDFVDLRAEGLPGDVGIENLRARELLLLFGVLEGVLDESHVPSSLESCIQCEYILVGGVHRAEDGEVGWNLNHMVRIAVDLLRDVGIGDPILALALVLLLDGAVEQLEDVAEDGWGVSAVDFFDDEEIVDGRILIGFLEDFRERPGDKFVDDFFFSSLIFLQYWKDLADEIGISVIGMENNPLHPVFVIAIIMLDCVALACARNAVQMVFSAPLLRSAGWVSSTFL